VDASDAILVRRALQEREAFAALYLRYLDEMGRFCFLRLHDEDAARDATQQVFAQALAGLANYRETGQFRAWLYTIARHVLANQARRRHVTFTLDTALEAVDPGLTPEETATATFEQHALLAAVSRLPDDQRTAIQLRLSGLTGPEIAAAMERSHDAVKKLQLRAVQRLRAELATNADTREVRRGA
jgi:RNA polymerase sigma-70 factor (ECF subfamily)